MYWPVAAINNLIEKTNFVLTGLSNENKLLLWFAQGTPSTNEIEALIRQALVIPENQPLPPNLMFLPTMLGYVVQYDTISTLDDLYNSKQYNMPTGLTQALLQAMVAQMATVDIAPDFSGVNAYNDCLTRYADNRSLCEEFDNYAAIQ